MSVKIHASEQARKMAYLKTDKGKESVAKYLKSDRRTLTNRWSTQDRRGTASLIRAKEFTEVYGNPDEVLSRLDPIEREVIELYCGLNNKSQMLVPQIAKHLNIPIKKVKKLKASGLKKL